MLSEPCVPRLPNQGLASSSLLHLLCVIVAPTSPIIALDPYPSLRHRLEAHSTSPVTASGISSRPSTTWGEAGSASGAPTKVNIHGWGEGRDGAYAELKMSHYDGGYA